MYQRLMAGVSMLPFRAPEDEGAGGSPPAPAAAAPAADPPPADPEPAPAAAADPAPEPEPKPARVPWQNKRIDALTAQRTAAEERAATLQRERDEALQQKAALEALYGKPEAAPADPAHGGERTYTKAELEAEAARIANTNRLNERLDDVFKSGLTKHGEEWNTRINQAGSAFRDELMKRGDFFEALASLPNPEDVYFALTGDLDHFGDVLSLTPTRLGIELATLSQKAGAKPKGPAVSGAPAPIDPVNGAGSREVPMEQLPMREFASKWEERRAARQKERNA